MKNKMIKRGLFGFPVGIAIGFVITVIISACVGDGNFYPVTPELAGTMGSELNAVILQTVLCGVMGAVGIFVAIFITVWLTQYLSWKRKIKKMNALVRKNERKE